MRNLILGLARPPLRLLGRDERGVIGVLVGILLGGGVLIGMGALVIDVGQLYQERAELQNGADAAAIAVAKSCATGTCTPGIAVSYADANSRHGLAAVNQVCGSGTLGACPASTGKITDCPAAPPTGTNYVDVHTSTQTSGGTVIPPVLAGDLLGNGNYQGTTVYACAQAAWGAPATLKTVAFTISACTWDAATNLGTTFAPPRPALPLSSFDQQINLKNLGKGAGCAGEAKGADGAGAFGWARDQTGSCGINTTSSTFAADVSASAGSACKTAIAAAWSSRTPIFLPVYTSLAGTVFRLKGFAAFVVTGYQLPSFRSSTDWLNSGNVCPGAADQCIEGYFTRSLVPLTSGGTGGTSGQDLGAVILALTG